MNAVNPSSIEPTHLIVAASISLAILMLTLTAVIIAGQRAIRRCIRRTRRSRSPEYWRMYARVCDAQTEPRRVLVPDIDEPL